jgi:hypothetical protein
LNRERTWVTKYKVVELNISNKFHVFVQLRFCNKPSHHLFFQRKEQSLKNILIH